MQDSLIFIEQHKSGFERPADLEFEDYSHGIKPANSENTLNPPKLRPKLWPFKKLKVYILMLFSVCIESICVWMICESSVLFFYWSLKYLG